MEWFNNSKLFDLAKQGQRLTHVAAVIALAPVFIFLSKLGVLPLALVAYAFIGTLSINAGDLSALQAGFLMSAQLIFTFAPVYACLWAWLKFFEKRPFWTLGYTPNEILKKYARGALFGILMFAGTVGILAALGTVSFDHVDPAQQGFAALGGVTLMLLGWIMQGGAEEALVRGWVLSVIGARYKPWIGLLVSAIIFSLLHGLNTGVTPLALFNLVLFSIFAGLYAMREGSLWGISAFHSLWNWAQGNFFGLETSGGKSIGGALVDLTTTGRDWLTGGAFGPEGGLAVTIVLIIGILVILFWKQKQEVSA
jgi:membrane protease YdiL (CAAX protease family)